MRTIRIIIGSILIFAFSNCSFNNRDANRYITKFEQHKDTFEALVALLTAQHIKGGYPINENELPQQIQDLLQKLDISEVNLNNTHCQGLLDYEFTTSWSNKATVYFSKGKCNGEQTVKGSHEIVSEMIEVWGLGDEWIMWIDRDPI